MINPHHLVTAHPELGQAARLVVGYSGGLDSTVLLHLTRAAFPEADLHALHVHHGLSPHADTWQQHCAQQCAAWQIPFVAERVTLPPGGIEDSARRARYNAYRRHLQAGDVLLQAHHADDQAETLLFRLLRSGGSHSLAGIPPQRSWGAGQILRPLLPFRRAELEAYARYHGLSWVEDESNRDDAYDRNYLRLQVLPLLEQRWPHAVTALCTSAARAREEATLLEEWAEEHLEAADERPERVGWSIALSWFADHSEERWGYVLRHWARLRQLPVPGERVLARFGEDVLRARHDTMPVLQWRGASLRRYRGRLYLLAEAELLAEAQLLVEPELGTRAASGLAWRDFPAPLMLPDGFELRAVQDPNGPFCVPAGAQLTVRGREGGERCTPHWRQHSHPLKKLLQDAALEPWLRDRVPLLYCNGELAAVGDLWVCKPFAVSGNGGGFAAQRWRLHWHRPRAIG